ncbi:EamA-like transporter family [Seminavis robusta]|uniref:EamA-like transporter family n=1 Tax=Seminavis robusta TaxID=568900 RepID=A0A9N8E1H5_9STRA|nr:EamA-like transporter family [Seminavis robusta]|eukprot:Sro452_g145950.1 EamA-like transporter family (525) ;mRNA; r:47306-48967
MVRLPLHLSVLLAVSSCEAFSSRRAALGKRHLPFFSNDRLQTTFLNYQSNTTDVALPPWVTEWHHIAPLEERTVLWPDEEPLPLGKAPRIRDDDEELSFVQETTTTTTAEKQPMSDVAKARLLLLGSAALYGTNFSLVKILGETGMSVGLSSTLRFGMAALATLPWLLSVDDHDDQSSSSSYLQKLFDPSGTEFRAAMGGLEVGMWNAIGYVAQAVGLETTSASKSAFLCSLAVVTVPIIDYLAGKTLLSRQVIGALLAVVGVAFLELEGGIGANTGLEAGDIASLIQPLAFGIGFWRMEAAMTKFPEEADRATAAQLLAVFLGSAGYMLATNTFSDPTTIPPMEQLVSWVTDPAILGALFWTGVVTTALTIYMETVALKTLSAAETTLIFSTEPLWGTAFACVVMGETLGLNAAAGAVMILFGCVFSNLGLDGMISFLPGQPDKKESADSDNKDVTMMINLEQPLELSADDSTATLFPSVAPTVATTSNQNLLPTDPLTKFSLKSTVATTLAGVVATIEDIVP